MTDDSSHLIIGIDSVDEAEYRLKYCTLSSFGTGKPSFPHQLIMRTRLVRESPALPYGIAVLGYSKPRAAERFLMGWCRGGAEVVPGWRCEFRQARGKVGGWAKAVGRRRYGGRQSRCRGG